MERLQKLFPLQSCWPPTCQMCSNPRAFAQAVLATRDFVAPRPNITCMIILTRVPALTAITLCQWICLFWTFYTNGITSYVVFCV